MSKYNLIDIYEEYQIGSGWTRDFDYDGMLKAGLKTGVDTDIELLKKMAEDYTDVNYHREASHLYNAIEALEDGATKEASMFFGDFHAEIKNTIKDQGMDIEPTVGKFMASKMEEGEEVKEVTSREGSRIEGDLNIELKAKFLDAFVDLFQSLDDPYFPEDVVDHLANEMLKHLDAIQAQGEKLAGVNEEDSIEEEKDSSAKDLLDKIKKHLIDKFGSKYRKSEYVLYIDSLDRDIKRGEFDGVESISMSDHEEDFENYIADKALQEHFGRFMKDYQ